MVFDKIWFIRGNEGVGTNILNYSPSLPSPTIVRYTPLGVGIGSDYRDSEIVGWGTLSFSFHGRFYYTNKYFEGYWNGVEKLSNKTGENLLNYLEDWASLGFSIQIKVGEPKGYNLYPRNTSTNEYFWIKSFKAPRKKTEFCDWTLDAEYMR